MMTHEEISKKAREIWEREGRPEGRDIEHWLQAEAELRQEPAANGVANNNVQSGDTSMLKVPAGLSSKDESGRRRQARRAR